MYTCAQRLMRGLDRLSMLHQNSKMPLCSVAPCRILSLRTSVAAVYSAYARRGFALQPSAPGHLQVHSAVRSHSTCGPLTAEVDVECLPRHILLLRHGHTAKLEAIQRELHISNHRIPLSEEGTDSAHQAGRALRHLLVHGHMPHHRQHHLQQQEEQVEQQQVQALLQDHHLQQAAAQQEPELVMAAAALSSQRSLQADTGAVAADSSAGWYASSPVHHRAVVQSGGSASSSSSSSGYVPSGSSHRDSFGGVADGNGGSGSSSNSMQCFIYSSPYLRCIQTAQHVARVLDDSQVLGVQEEVQLREQDWCQQPESAMRCYNERLAYGRFFYRFPEGESAADVYDRLTIWQDHFVRDMCTGRFAGQVVLLVSHGLTLRVWLMRWLRWTVDQFLQVHNLPHAVPLVLSLDPSTFGSGAQVRRSAVAVKSLFKVTPATLQLLQGVDPSMGRCSGAVDRATLLSWRPYWDMVPPVPGTQQQEELLHEMMAVGYRSSVRHEGDQ